ncbi:hypothetical protein H9P43_004417 [Blastocladiella emersonii ATCC 22665]|nr:hypothetical protein H9P43_004417 [Blastocladiella emersonii ATCC 22665]
MAPSPLPASAPGAVGDIFDKALAEFPSSFSKKNRDLVEGFTALIKRLDALQAAGGALAPASSSASDVPVDAPVTPLDLWAPLRRVLDARHPPRVREMALDATQKLLALSLLHGPGPTLDEDFTLVDAAMATPTPSASVPPLSASPPAQSSSSPAMMGEAAAMLSADPVDITKSPRMRPDDAAAAESASTPSILPGGILSPLEPGAVTIGGAASTTAAPPTPSLIDDIIATASVAYLPISQNVSAEEPVHIQVLKVLLTASTLSSLVVHNMALLKSLQTCFNFYLYSRNKNIVTTARAALTQILSSVVAKVATDPHPQSARDAYISVRALCKLASKTFAEPNGGGTGGSGSGTAAGDTSFTVRCRSLALELLSSVINQLTQAKSPAVTEILASQTADLSVAISKNATSSHTGLFESSLALFVMLLVHYRPLFKSQIAVLLCDVYFPVLAGNASTHHKQLLLQNLVYLANSPQLLVDLYVNFDCDLGQPSCLEEFLAACCSQASPPLALLSTAAIEGALKSLTVWMAREAPAAPAASVEALGSSPVSGDAGAVSRPWSPDEDAGAIASRSVTDMLGNGSTATASAAAAVLTASVGSGAAGPASSTPGNAGSTLSIDGSVAPTDGTATAAGSATPAPLHAVVTAASELFHGGGGGSGTPRQHSGGSDEHGRAAEEVIIAKKMHTKHGLELFNQSPSKGVAYLTAYDVVAGKDADATGAALAQFFHANPPNKTKLGEFLGELDQIHVMHAYVDAMDFRGLEFVDALRYFLSGFRLPGEAQKIDRFMEKFSDKYCGDNPNIFSNADTAYVLAFSVIMLNTDQHSKQVKKRMSKEDFVKNNRRIDNAAVLTDDYFEKIYDEIKSNEIQLDEEPELEVTEDEDQRKELYKRESQVIQKRSQQKMRGAKDVTAWKTAELPDYSRLIYQGAHAMVVSFLVANKSHTGLRYCVQLATRFALREERLEAVEAMVQLAGLSRACAPGTPLDMSATSALLHTAQSVAPALGEAWEPVLAVLSELDKRGIALDNETTVQVDCVFTNTAHWPAPALIHFITALCHVSGTEVADKRSYSLQRLVEVASYNINRIRFEFNQIFRLVLGYFEDVVRTDEDIARFAVDSLRQLTSKFLERDELAHFNSQVEFMRPFHNMMVHATSAQLQELILISLMQLVQARFRNMKSGWKAVFPVVSLGKSHAIAKDILVLVHRHLAELQHVAAVQDYVACLADVCSIVDSTELLDILVGIPTDRPHVLRGLVTVILTQPVLAIRSRAVDALFSAIQASGNSLLGTPAAAAETCDAILFPLFRDNARLDVVWVQALQRYVRLWMAYPGSATLAGVCRVIALSVEQHNENIAQCAVICFQEMLKHVVANGTPPQAAATSGTGSVAGTPTVSNGGGGSGLAAAAAAEALQASWPTLISTLTKIAQSTLPRGLELSAPAPGDVDAPVAPDFAFTTQQCAIHLLLLTNLQPFLAASPPHPSVPLDFYAAVLPSLRASCDFAAAFNNNVDLRTRIWRAGLTANPPNLLRQEALTTALILTTLMCITHAFAGQEVRYVRALQDAGDDLIDEFLGLPAAITASASPLAIKAKPFAAPNVALLFNKLADAMFVAPGATSLLPIAPHFFRRGLALLREDEPVTRVAVVGFLEQVTTNVLDPLWAVSIAAPAPRKPADGGLDVPAPSASASRPSTPVGGNSPVSPTSVPPS